MRAPTAALLAALPTAAGVMHHVTIAGGGRMPMVVLGTGSGQKGDVTDATKLWLKAGATGFDTAYQYGSAQKEIASGLSAAGAKRSDVFIESKIPCGSYSTAQKDIAKDLSDLKVDYVDLMLIHFECSSSQLADTWRALEDALSAGQAKAIGVSHFTASDIKKLMKTANVKPAVNQCLLNVRKHADSDIQYCKDNGIVYQSYSPLCGGGSGSSCRLGSVLDIKEVKSIASAHGVSAAQVGLKWIVQQGLPLTTAVWKADYMKEDIDLWSFNLTSAEMTTLSGIAAQSGN